MVRGKVLGRLVNVLFVLMTIVLINFFLLRLVPGDPAAAMAGDVGLSDPALLVTLRKEFALDQPLMVQLVVYLKKIALLDFGESYRNGRPVSELIGSRLGPTALLMGAAFTASLLAGMAVGTFASYRERFFSGRIIVICAQILYSLPLYWFGLLLVLVFSVWLGWLPTTGMEAPGQHGWSLFRVLDIARHLILPTVTLGVFYFAVYVLYTRTSVSQVRQQEYVRAARAMGIHEHRVTFGYVLPNALLPIITLAGMQAGNLVGGAVLIENVFAWPGIGQLALDAILQRDYNLLLAIFLICGVMTVVFNAAADIAYGMLDPRIRSGR